MASTACPLAEPSRWSFGSRQAAPKRLLKHAGLPESYRVHDLRHSTATYLLAAGVPDRLVMGIMGHSQLSMTMRYQHVLPSMLKEAAARLEAIFPTAM